MMQETIMGMGLEFVVFRPGLPHPSLRIDDKDWAANSLQKDLDLASGCSHLESVDHNHDSKLELKSSMKSKSSLSTQNLLH